MGLATRFFVNGESSLMVAGSMLPFISGHVGAVTAALMPAIKGAIVGLQWALRMHGFDYSAARERAMAPE